MHISEGLLNSSGNSIGSTILVAGWGLTAAGLGLALWRLDERRIPMVALLSSTFFVATLVSFPGPFSPIHLLLCGLLGVMLGLQTIPAVFIALLLQCLMFGYGGITSLGVNTVVMALPGVICGMLFSRGICSPSKILVILASVATAITGILLAVSLYLLCFLVTDKNLTTLATYTLISHIPVAVIESLVTPMIVISIRKIRPDFFVRSDKLFSIQS